MGARQARESSRVHPCRPAMAGPRSPSARRRHRRRRGSRRDSRGRASGSTWWLLTLWLALQQRFDRGGLRAVLVAVRVIPGLAAVHADAGVLTFLVQNVKLDI